MLGHFHRREQRLACSSSKIYSDGNIGSAYFFRSIFYLAQQIIYDSFETKTKTLMGLLIIRCCRMCMRAHLDSSVGVSRNWFKHMRIKRVSQAEIFRLVGMYAGGMQKTRDQINLHSRTAIRNFTVDSLESEIISSFGNSYHGPIKCQPILMRVSWWASYSINFVVQWVWDDSMVSYSSIIRIDTLFQIDCIQTAFSANETDSIRTNEYCSKSPKL